MVWDAGGWGEGMGCEERRRGGSEGHEDPVTASTVIQQKQQRRFDSGNKGRQCSADTERRGRGGTVKEARKEGGQRREG